MNKSELIDELSRQLDIPYKKADKIVNAIFESIEDAMKKGDRVEVRGFGSFVMRDYRPYIGRNPKSGEKIQVKAKRLPFFKAGKDIKDRVNSRK
ncbi:MAG: integration host factor subunit beta [Deltaproteobacteria bacterium]|nr:MAG: integration host factor subunit beta [Deltaproteobacteria bacterium]